MLRRWAEEKYKIPWTHECFQSQSLFELLISFWEDQYQKNPIASKTTQDGNVMFANTGDPMIDKWEEELAKGLSPDLLDGVSPEEREREHKALEKLKRQKVVSGTEGLEQGFSESYLGRQNLPVMGGGLRGR